MDEMKGCAVIIFSFAIAMVLIIGSIVAGTIYAGESKSHHQIACIKAGGQWSITTGDCVSNLNQPYRR
jgi:hypothetical protein